MDLNEARSRMQKVIEVIQNDLATIRTGRATPSLIEHVVVSVYGGSTRLKLMELATIATSDPQTLVITPFDGSIISEIQKGLEIANIGLTPVVDGQIIRISIPPLSAERREQLVALMKQKLENGKIMVRQVRQDAMQDAKKQLADKEISEDDLARMEKDVQNLTDKTIEEIDAMGERKAQELQQL